MESGTKLGHYEISALLGKGGMGEVWRARDTKLGRDVAIKTLPERGTRPMGQATGTFQDDRPQVRRSTGPDRAGTTRRDEAWCTRLHVEDDAHARD